LHGGRNFYDVCLWKEMALGVAEMRHFKRNRGSERGRVPR
jgi:hypothetical protein